MVYYLIGCLYLLRIYNVDEKTRNEEIKKVLDKDCRDISKQVLNAFTEFVEKSNAAALKTMQDSLSKNNDN